jgi:hypothetical protein
MLIQPDKIVLLYSNGDESDVDAVPLPSGSIVHFDTSVGSFRFLHQDGNLHPRCKDDDVLSALLDAAIQSTPGAAGARHGLASWIASSRLTDDARTVVRKDLFTIQSVLSVFAVGVAQEVDLGPIFRMRAFTP